VRLTAPYDVTGIPAISVPCGFDADGLPIGLMIGARHFDEVTLCRVAHAYEQATEWHGRRPPLGLGGLRGTSWAAALPCAPTSALDGAASHAPRGNR
jgi:hypothetical protein